MTRQTARTIPSPQFRSRAQRRSHRPLAGSGTDGAGGDKGHARLIATPAPAQPHRHRSDRSVLALGRAGVHQSASTVGCDLGERRLAQRFPGFADTEEVTGSIPVAPTIALLSRAFADPAVQPMPWSRWRRRRHRQESTSLLTKVFSSAGCRTCEWSSNSPPPAQTPPRDRAASFSGPTRPRVMRYKHSPGRIQALAELTWSSRRS